MAWFEFVRVARREGEGAMIKLVRSVLLSGAFVAGLTIPLVASWPAPAQATRDCTLLSGGDSWTGTNADGSSFTVTASGSGLSVTGTPPPIASLPRVLTSTNGNSLTITATSAGGRWYSGTFTGETEETCNCPNLRCDSFDIVCVPQNLNWCKITSPQSCLYGGCSGSGGGSCSGGKCLGPVVITAPG